MEKKRLGNAWTCWRADSDQANNSNHYSLQQYIIGNALYDDAHVLYYRLFNDTYEYDQYFMNADALSTRLSELSLYMFKEKTAE